jgi:hypothetical protein
MVDVSYSGLSFRSPGPIVTVGRLKEIETKHKVAFPEDFVDFLLHVNGGVPRPSGFRFLDERPPSPGQGNDDTVRWLCDQLRRCTVPEECEHFQREIEFLRNSYVPKRVSMLFQLEGHDNSIDWYLSQWTLVGSGKRFWFVPVGMDSSNCLLMLCVTPPVAGAVYAGVQGLAVLGDENVLDDDTATDIQGNEIGWSFSDFLQRLFPARVLHSAGYLPPAQVRYIHRLDMYDE